MKELKKLWLSPHDDDAVLFGAFTCMREQPTVLVILDAYVQSNRGEIGCDMQTRALENQEAVLMLECKSERLGLRDDDVSEDAIFSALGDYQDFDVVYAPALQGGNKHHDMVCRAAEKMYGTKVIHYTTYTKSELWTEGELEVKPTEEELELKNRALECYQSQMKLPATAPHFYAVIDKSEWLGNPQKVYIGAGKHHMDGWLHVDRHPFPNADIVADVAQGLPFKDSSIGHLYSQDFMEHLRPESKIDVINEIWRVLKPGGIMEHIIPQAGSQNDFGSPTHLSHWNQQQFEHFDVNSYRYEMDRDYEGFKGGFEKVLSELASNGQTFHVVYKAVK